MGGGGGCGAQAECEVAQGPGPDVLQAGLQAFRDRRPLLQPLILSHNAFASSGQQPQMDTPS